MRELKISHIQLDALREVSSIACGNAATSLARMLGRKVEVSVPRIRIEAAEKVPAALGGSEKIVDAVYFSVTGGVAGNMLLLFPHPAALQMAALLTGGECEPTARLNAAGISAIQETGNIMAGWYVRALAGALRTRVSYSIPGYAYDMLGAVLDGILARLSVKADYALLSENGFTVEGLAYSMDLLFIPEPGTLELMLRVLGGREA